MMRRPWLVIALVISFVGGGLGNFAVGDVREGIGVIALVVIAWMGWRDKP